MAFQFIKFFQLSKRKFLSLEQIISINLIHTYLLLLFKRKKSVFQVHLESSFL